MKVLCDCWRKSDTCFACYNSYMANLEDWNQIHAIAMSAEAQRRLEEDLRFLESINVWHLVNLRATPPPPSHALYGYGDAALDIITPSTEHGSAYPPYHHAQYHQRHHHHPSNPALYLQGNRYLSPAQAISATPTVADLNRQNNRAQLSSPGYGTSLPYPDLIIHATELPPPPPPTYYSHKTADANRISVSPMVTPNQFDEVKRSPSIIKKSNYDFSEDSASTIIQNNALSLQDPNSRLKQLPPLPTNEPDDYDAEDTLPPPENGVIPQDGKKSVQFSSDTIFVERDMNSPFWKAFTERRRLRRINRQRKQLNAQIESASYQPSLVDIVKSAFTRSSPSKDANENCTKRKHTKGEVLIYDNSTQLPGSYTAQYVYATPVQSKRSSKFLQMLSCQCCSGSPSC